MINYKQKITPRHPKPSYAKNMLTLGMMVGTIGGMFSLAAPDTNRFRENLEKKLNGAIVATVRTESQGTINKLWVNEGYNTDTQRYGIIIYEELNSHSEPRLGRDGTTTMTFLDLDGNGEIFATPYNQKNSRKLTKTEKNNILQKINKYSN